MKFTVNQKLFLETLKAASKTLNNKPHLPILVGIRIVAQKDKLIFTTTDLTAGLKIELAAAVQVEGEAIVNGKALIDAANFFDQEETTIFLDGQKIIIRNGKDRVSLPVLTGDYPDFPLGKIDFQEFEFSFWEIIVKKVAFAASNDLSRPALTGILLKNETNKLTVVCTDGFRLVVLATKTELDKLDEHAELIVSARAIIDCVALAQIFNLEKISFGFDQENEQIVFAADNFTYFSKTINSNYPPFEKIVPLEFATEVVLDRAELVKNLNKASVLARSVNNVVKLTVDKEKVDFFANSIGDSTWEGEQTVEKQQGEKITISFNIRYLLDFLAESTNDTVWIGFNNETTPAMMKNSQEDELKYIIMPFKSK